MLEIVFVGGAVLRLTCSGPNPDFSREALDDLRQALTGADRLVRFENRIINLDNVLHFGFVQ